MAKTQQARDVDYKKVAKAVKWLEKGAAKTQPLKGKEFALRGSDRKKKQVVAADTIGAIQVGFARTTTHREIRIKRDRYEGFWTIIDDFLRAYEEKYGVTVEQDTFRHGREYVLDRAKRI